MRTNALLLAATLAGMTTTGAAQAAGGKVIFKGTFSGFNVVPTRYSPVTGQVTVGLNADSIGYTVTFKGGQGPVIVIVLALGRPGTAGPSYYPLNAVARLCDNTPLPLSRLRCPPSGTLSGTLRAADIITTYGIGISEGEIGKVIEAIRAGAMNVQIVAGGDPSEARADLR